MSSEPRTPPTRPRLGRTAALLSIFACLAALNTFTAAQPEPESIGLLPGERGERADRRPGPPVELTDEQAAIVMEFLSTWRPETAENLQRLKEQDPAAFRQTLQRTAAGSERIRQMLFMHRHAPEGFAFRGAEFRAMVKAQRLGREAREAGEPGGDPIKQQLREAVAEMVDARGKVREHDLVQLEKRLAQLREDVKHQHEKRDEMIEKYYQRFLEPRGERSSDVVK